MSELISGKEAKLAWAEGVAVQVAIGPDRFRTLVSSDDLGIFDRGNYFRLKPRTISINGIDVPAPAEDEDYHHQAIWILNSLEPKEYSYVVLDITDELPRYWWRTEEEIKQVISALRSVFKGGV